MAESEIAERIAVRRAGLDELEVQLVKQLEEVRAERDELAVAERVWQRMVQQLAADKTIRWRRASICTSLLRSFAHPQYRERVRQTQVRQSQQHGSSSWRRDHRSCQSADSGDAAQIP